MLREILRGPLEWGSLSFGYILFNVSISYPSEVMNRQLGINVWNLISLFYFSYKEKLIAILNFFVVVQEVKLVEVL